MKESAGSKGKVRCAIYTRKSSEEGLEQSFNSLHAQREACEAYIRSQKHEGWIPLSRHYDDGGFSGGSMERPALKALLGDISSGAVNTVVVYKVDRLTRSLADFAKIIEVFDQQGVTFVSVTQQFNTTTSMGRLTLNVLLSFAQFEREVTGERIRDKIAASKRKGMWMGGNIPLGYDLEHRQLVVNPKEAALVREIYSQYLKLKSVNELKRYLDERRLYSKVRTSAQGNVSGGKPFSRGSLYEMLRNPIYIGKVSHGDQVYPGQHERIVEQGVWEQAGQLLSSQNRGRRTGATGVNPSLLTGLVFTPQGQRYTPTHSLKSGKRYRYYTSQAQTEQANGDTTTARVPALDLERLVTEQIRQLLASSDLKKRLAAAGSWNDLERAAEEAQALAQQWPWLGSEQLRGWVRQVLRRVVIGSDELAMEIAAEALVRGLLHDTDQPSGRQRSEGTAPVTLELRCGFTRSRRGSALHLVTPGTQPQPAAVSDALLRNVVRAQIWRERIIAGEIYCKEQLAQESGLNASYVGRILRLGTLSPQLVESILQNRTTQISAPSGSYHAVPLEWARQSANN